MFTSVCSLMAAPSFALAYARSASSAGDLRLPTSCESRSMADGRYIPHPDVSASVEKLWSERLPWPKARSSPSTARPGISGPACVVLELGLWRGSTRAQVLGPTISAGPDWLRLGRAAIPAAKPDVGEWRFALIQEARGSWGNRGHGRRSWPAWPGSAASCAKVVYEINPALFVSDEDPCTIADTC